MSTRWITDVELAERLHVSRTTPWRWVQLGAFPAPVSLAPGTTRWLLADVEAWEAERRAADREARTA